MQDPGATNLGEGSEGVGVVRSCEVFIISTVWRDVVGLKLIGLYWVAV